MVALGHCPEREEVGGLQGAVGDWRPDLVNNQKTREGCGCQRFAAGKVFRQISDAAGKLFTDFLAAHNDIPEKVWAFSGKEIGCWKIGLAFGNAPGFSPLRLPQPS